MEKLIKIIYKKEVQLTELDLINKDKLLGCNEDGDYPDHGYDLITDNDFYWYGEHEQCEIDSMIEALQTLKDSACNYVEIIPHNDHNGYYLYGLEMRLGTKEEIKEYKRFEKEKYDKQLEDMIKQHEKEIIKLKKKRKSHDKDI